MAPSIRRGVSGLSFACLALMANSVAADWLATHDGSRFEIEGPWEIDGDLVTFTLPNGTLGSMRLSAIDLEASQALTESAVAPANPAPSASEPMTKAEFVITDADVSHAMAGSVEDLESAGTATPDTIEGLRITSWRDRVDPTTSSVTVTGILQNPTRNPATSIALNVMLYGEDGTVLETRPADLEQSFLNPGASIRFEARFSDTLSFDTVGFDIQSRGFMSRPPEEEPGEDEGEAEGELDDEGDQS